MSPIVSKLERQGLPIRKVDIDVERDLASRFKVEGIPCFVLISNGREIDRISGATDEKTLRTMMQKLPKPTDDDLSSGKNVRNSRQANAGAVATTTPSDRKRFPKIPALLAKNTELKLTPTDAPDMVRGQNPNPEANGERFCREPLIASTRIRVTSGKDVRYGSGTIIDSEPGRAIILTCGHILRGAGKNSVVEVDYYQGNKSKPQTFTGEILRFDLDSDLGLLAVPSPKLLPIMKLGVATNLLAVKDRVVSIGCGGGENPTSEKHVITAVNRYQGPDNVECDGVPEQGRSGGGLFLGQELVGVCIAADPKDRRGIYTGLKPVVKILAKANLGYLVPSSSSAGDAVADIDTPDEKLALGNAIAASDDVLRRTDEEYADLLQEAAEGTGVPKFDSADYVGAEIVCIVRPKTPGALSRIVVVNQATSRFVDDLLRDSSGGSRSESKATARKSPRRAPTAKPTTLAMSESETNAKKTAVNRTNADEFDNRVETAFQPQRNQRSRD